MWKILFVIMMNSDYHAEPAVTAQLIGEYKTLDICKTISKQLEAGYPSSIPTSISWKTNVVVTARCVQTKEEK